MTESNRRDMERGPKGDHGQDGVRGRTGLQGKPAPPVLSWFVVVLMVIFIVIAFGLLTYKLGKSASRAQEASRDALNAGVVACEHSNANSRKINALIDRLITNAQENPPTLPPGKIQERVEKYKALKIKIVKCG